MKALISLIICNLSVVGIIYCLFKLAAQKKHPRNGNSDGRKEK